jgi:hypothetical protein
MGDSPEFDGTGNSQARGASTGREGSPYQNHLDLIIRRHRLMQIKWRMRYLRFRLRTMLLVATAFCILCLVLRECGADIYANINERWKCVPATPVGSAVAIPLLVLSVVMGPLVAALAYKLGSHGYFLFVALSVAALFTLVISLSLDTAPLQQTELRDISFAQVLRASLPLVVGVLPLASFLGYCVAASEGRT